MTFLLYGCPLRNCRHERVSVHLPRIKTGCVQAVGCLLVVGVHPHNLHSDDERCWCFAGRRRPALNTVAAATQWPRRSLEAARRDFRAGPHASTPLVMKYWRYDDRSRPAGRAPSSSGGSGSGADGRRPRRPRMKASDAFQHALCRVSECCRVSTPLLNHRHLVRTTLFSHEFRVDGNRK